MLNVAKDQGFLCLLGLTELFPQVKMPSTYVLGSQTFSMNLAAGNILGCFSICGEAEESLNRGGPVCCLLRTQVRRTWSLPMRGPEHFKAGARVGGSVVLCVCGAQSRGSLCQCIKAVYVAYNPRLIQELHGV